MINNTLKKLPTLATTLMLAGCAAGGYNNYGVSPYGNNTYGGSPYGNNSYGFGSANNASPMANVLNAIIQSMGANVLNGQIGSQLSPADQNFRLQQLSGLLQSGGITQAQQWLNPQTGNSITLNPVGQSSINSQTQQQCHNLEETVISRNGQRIQETRLACFNPQTGKWNLVR